MRSNLSNNDRKKIKTIIIVDVHNRDIIAEFVRQNVLDKKSFNWECQIRFYWLKQRDNLYAFHWSGRFHFIIFRFKHLNDY